jgi:hypothetical protein
MDFPHEPPGPPGTDEYTWDTWDANKFCNLLVFIKKNPYNFTPLCYALVGVVTNKYRYARSKNDTAHRKCLNNREHPRLLTNDSGLKT